MESQEVKDYLSKLPDSMTAAFNSLDDPTKDKQIFAATELLSDYYNPSNLTGRIVALQIIYALEAEEEEFAKLKRHGVQSMSTKGTSVTFSNAAYLAPSVIDLLGQPRKKAFIGRIV